MTRPVFEMADIFRRKGRQFIKRFKAVLSYQQLKACRAVERCRTRALGGHKDKCEGCQYEAPISYNSCRSRCCPKCQAQARRRWLEAQRRDLLNTNYFHVVFTVPHELNPLALSSRRPLLDLLFDASSQTLLEVARDPKRLGAEIGFLSILHTWSSNLLPHYHVHCVVPGGGLSADHQRWIPTSHPMFLMPVPVLRRVFREKFLSGLRHLYRKRLLKLRGPAAPLGDPATFERLIKKLGNKKWYVYAKPPFGGPEQVLRYLGRYTHRMAISNHRITAFDGERVSFRWRDYAHGGKQRIMTLDAVNFLCRFFLHVLPKGFVRIRRYGLLSNRFRKELLPLARTLLAEQGHEPLLPPPLPDCAPWHCPRCGKAMRVVERFTSAQLFFAAFDTS
jgi:Putative transposase/Transposase zinc-binding domain